MNTSEYKVVSGGYLIPAPKNKEDEKIVEKQEIALMKAHMGKDPGLYDDSSFIKVNNSLVGKNLLVEEDNFGKVYLVKTKSGRIINFEKEKPLSREKWQDSLIGSLGFHALPYR